MSRMQLQTIILCLGAAWAFGGNSQAQSRLANEDAIDAAVRDWESLAKKYPVVRYTMRGTVLTRARSINAYDEDNDEPLSFPKRDITHDFTRALHYDLVNVECPNFLYQGL